MMLSKKLLRLYRQLPYIRKMLIWEPFESGGQMSEASEERTLFETNWAGNNFKILVRKAPDGRTEYTLRISGRVNCERPIQYFDVYLRLRERGELDVASLLVYALRGEFSVIEGERKYIMKPEEDLVYWSIMTESGDTIARVKEETLINILIGKRVDEVLREAIGEEMISDRSEQILSMLSEMLSSKKFDYDTYTGVLKYLEETEDERVRDLLRIVQRTFKKEISEIEKRSAG